MKDEATILPVEDSAHVRLFLMKQDPSVVVPPVSGSLGILHLGREAGGDGGGHQLQLKWQRQTIVTFRLAFFILLPSFHVLLALVPPFSFGRPDTNRSHRGL